MKLIPDFLRPRLAGVTIDYYDDHDRLVQSVAYAANGTGALPYNEPCDLTGEPFTNILYWRITDIRWRWPK